MKLPIFVVAVSAFAIAGPAVGQTEASAVAEESEEEEVEEDPGERVRCVNLRVTGSNARRNRVCLTQNQWTELARNGNRDARRVVGWGASCPTPDAGC